MSSNIKLTIYTKILECSIFYFVLMNSLLRNNISISIINLSRILIFLVLGLALVWNVFFYQDLNAKLKLLVLALIMILLFFINASQFSCLIFFAMYCLFIKPYKVIKLYFNGILYGIVIVVLLSLTNFIPKQQGNLWVFGFPNPNIIGFLVVAELLSYFILKWYRINFFDFIVFLLCIFFEKKILSDGTAVIVLLIFLTTYMVSKNPKLFLLVRKLTLIAPIFLLAFSWFLASYYGKYNWIYRLSNFLTYRPEIWHDYLEIYGVHLLPSRMTILFATDFQKLFYGGNLPRLYAGFDTSYMYLLLSGGLIILLFIIFILSNFVYRVKDNPAFICYSLALFIFGFTETPVLTPLGYYQNALLMIALAGFIDHSYFKTICRVKNVRKLQE